MNKLLATIDRITKSAAEDFDLKRENGNIDGNTAMGVMLRYGSEASKEYVLNNVLKKEWADAHRNGDIHIHDLDFYILTTTCTQIDLTKLFTRGFNTGHGFLREPQSITTAAALACIAIQSNQNDQHGGQSIPAFDYMLAPYVKKSYEKHRKEIIQWNIELYGGEPSGYDNDIIDILAWEKTTKETRQAMEAVIHNLNTMHSRAGAQVPFSSLNYGTDTSKEGRLVTESILLATDRGMGRGETPIFPIQIFKCQSGVNLNEGDPNYDLFRLACAVSGKRLFPNFSFLDAPYNKAFLVEGKPETEVAYMGCRTRVIANANGEDQAWGRGNLSFTSINLPRIAINANQDEAAFLEELDRLLELCRDQLIHRAEIIGGKTKKNFPFMLGSGTWVDSENLDEDESILNVIKQGTLSIGFIGLAEAITSMLSRHHGIYRTGVVNPNDAKAWTLAYDVVKYMRMRCDEFTRDTGWNFTLLGTPAEGLSGRFVLLDKEKYGIIEGVTDKDYYTNSFHLPVSFDCNISTKIDLEAPFHELCNAGHITYVEVDGNIANNVDAMETIVKHMSKSGVGYGAINHPVDYDSECGYVGVIGDTCPRCGRIEGDVAFQRIRRITGYLTGTLNRWNDAKRSEEHDRVKHGGLK